MQVRPENNLVPKYPTLSRPHISSQYALLGKSTLPPYFRVGDVVSVSVFSMVKKNLNHEKSAS